MWLIIQQQKIHIQLNEKKKNQFDKILNVIKPKATSKSVSKILNR